MNMRFAVGLAAGAVVAGFVLASPARAGKESLSIAVTEPAPATLAAELYTPSGNGPYPAVVVMHGCAGIGPNVPGWARWLQSEGYAALVVDSFSARGIRTLCADPRPLRPSVRANDLFAAIAKLKSSSAIDPSRIAVIGLSNGGSTVLEAWREFARHPDAAPRAIVAFYPGCLGKPAPAGAPPVLILIGADDDWTPPDVCRKLTESSREAGRDVSIVVYPGTRHHFDDPTVRGRVFNSLARGGKGATIEYNPKSHEDAEKQVKQFLAERLKP